MFRAEWWLSPPLTPTQDGAYSCPDPLASISHHTKAPLLFRIGRAPSFLSEILLAGDHKKRAQQHGSVIVEKTSI